MQSIAILISKFDHFLVQNFKKTISWGTFIKQVKSLNKFKSFKKRLWVPNAEVSHAKSYNIQPKLLFSGLLTNKCTRSGFWFHCRDCIAWNHQSKYILQYIYTHQYIVYASAWAGSLTLGCVRRSWIPIRICLIVTAGLQSLSSSSKDKHTVPEG